MVKATTLAPNNTAFKP